MLESAAMPARPRTVDLAQDQDFVLELHCQGNYESDTPCLRRLSYEAYRQHWLGTRQPEGFLRHLQISLGDSRAFAEVWEDDGRPIGFLWVGFTDTDGYGTIAEVWDIELVADYRGRGLGMEMLAHAEAVARDRGAHILRSETGVENQASQALHAKAGFQTYRLLFEKLLRAPPGLTRK